MLTRRTFFGALGGIAAMLGVRHSPVVQANEQPANVVGVAMDNAAVGEDVRVLDMAYASYHYARVALMGAVALPNVCTVIQASQPITTGELVESDGQSAWPVRLKTSGRRPTSRQHTRVELLSESDVIERAEIAFQKRMSVTLGESA